jgi:TonB family protein
MKTATLLITVGTLMACGGCATAPPKATAGLPLENSSAVEPVVSVPGTAAKLQVVYRPNLSTIYPEHRNDILEGTLIAAITIAASGEVEEVRILESTDDQLNEPWKRFLERWRFQWVGEEPPPESATITQTIELRNSPKNDPKQQSAAQL